MLGVVIAGALSRRRILGLSVGARCVLALQAAGVERVVVIGENAADIAASMARDDRRRIAVSACDSWEGDAALVLADGAVVDAAAVRALSRAKPGSVVMDRECPVAWHSVRAGSLRAETEAVAVNGVGRLALRDEQAAECTRALLDSLRKSQDGWIAKALNRHLSLAVTRLLVLTPVRPNQLTAAILAIGLYGAWLASLGTYLGFAVGGVLFQLQSVLDGCDGELSRLTFRGSKTGEWLDTIGDDITNYAFFGGAAVGLWRAGLGPVPLILGGAGVTIGVLASAIEYAYLLKVGSGDLLKYPLGFGKDPEPSAEPTRAARWLGALRPAFKRDFFVFVAMLAAMAGARALFAMLALFVGGAVATCGAVLNSEWQRRGVKPGEESSASGGAPS